MTSLKTLQDQILLAKAKTDQLLSGFTDEQWSSTPSVLETNLNWQIGHINLANYLHGIASITGKNEEINSVLSMKDYLRFYGPNSSPSMFNDEKPSMSELLKTYDLIFEIVNKGLQSISVESLSEDTEVPNPAVKTKYEALLWMSQHQSWHNGQIALLKRVINSDNG